VVSKRRK